MGPDLRRGGPVGGEVGSGRSGSRYRPLAAVLAEGDGVRILDLSRVVAGNALMLTSLTLCFAVLFLAWRHYVALHEAAPRIAHRARQVSAKLTSVHGRHMERRRTMRTSALTAPGVPTPVATTTPVQDQSSIC